MKRVWYYEETLAPQKPSLPFSLISSTYSFLFFPKNSLPSLPNSQTKPNDTCIDVEVTTHTWIHVFTQSTYKKIFFFLDLLNN